MESKKVQRKKILQKCMEKRMYGKARYADTVRYSQIQNSLARVFKHSREKGSPPPPFICNSREHLSRESV